MIIVRVYRGVADHFPIRMSEWVMLWPALGLWIGLQLSPDMFETSNSFAYLAHWADERTWAAIIGLCGLMRLSALTINGTFKGFAFSPHIRAAASIVGAAIWSQVSLGFLMAWMNVGGAPSGAVAWSTMVLLEIMNTYRSWSDVGKNAAERG
ncbi:hypothetical protein [Aliihoeflea sp. 2WW]|uniref:hypothetical protein n=1 Tax=Aliihoeflea sp. 2WW TaxID=1381123 RepID=UPI000466F8ED|nr:hypothetical protein [Aliihoeflea sp. 2WW]